MKMLTERIRSPISKMGNGYTVSMPNINGKRRNVGVRSKVEELSEESEETEKEDMERKGCLRFVGLNVVGKDLLEVEAEHFNDMKSRTKKFYYSQVQNSPSEEFEILPEGRRKKEKENGEN